MDLGSGIILDIIAAAILLSSVILGARKGLVLTVISFMQWFVCVILGFIFCEQVKAFLIDNTGLDETLIAMISGHAEASIESSAPYQAMPDLFGSWISAESGDFIYGTAASIAESSRSAASYPLYTSCNLPA